jgi:hypothetical protein
MNGLDIIYITVTLVVGIAGIWAFLGLYNQFVPRKPQKGKNAAEVDPFRAAGIAISLKQYNLIRITLYIVLVGMMLYQFYMTRTLSPVVLALLVAFVAITTPTMPGVSLVPKLLKHAAAARRKRLNSELLRAIVHLKTLALTGTGINAYEILRKLMRQAKGLKPALSEVIKAWHNPTARIEAIDVFQKTIGTEDATNFANIITKMDTTSMAELNNELTMYEQKIMERRQTEREATAGTLSSIFFSMVTALLMTVLANFIFTVVISSLTQSLTVIH